MQIRTLFLLSVIFAFLQGPVLPAVFVEGFLLILVVLGEYDEKGLLSNKAFLQVFGFSFVFDLIQGQSLGLTSLLFLAISFGLAVFKRNLFARKEVFLAVIVVCISFIRAKVVFGSFYPLSLLFIFFVTFFYARFVRRPDYTGLRIQ